MLQMSLHCFLSLLTITFSFSCYYVQQKFFFGARLFYDTMHMPHFNYSDLKASILPKHGPVN